MDLFSKHKMLVILGPTATGKTDLALSLAKKFNGELVSCDSRQVYIGLDIGTGKSPGSGKWLASRSEEVRCGSKKWEVGGVNIWMYDVVSPTKQYTVYNFVKDANRVIRKIRDGGKLPIIVGGSGLYLKALLGGLPNLAIPLDLKLRKQLERLSLEELQEKLQRLSPKRWQKMNDSDRQNPRRLIRAIEIIQNSKLKSQSSKLQLKTQNYNVLKIGLMAPREILYRRIDERLMERIDHGMVDEANRLHKSGLSLKRMKQLGLEYGVLADYLEGKIESKEELERILQRRVHSYARRQITWFKKEKDVFWFNIQDQDCLNEVEKVVATWYHSVK